jgi:hypothetical protein
MVAASVLSNRGQRGDGDVGTADVCGYAPCVLRIMVECEYCCMIAARHGELGCSGKGLARRVMVKSC